MAKLAITPVAEPVDFNTAMRQLYTHARLSNLQVVPDGIYNNQHRFKICNPRTNVVVSKATIDE